MDSVYENKRNLRFINNRLVKLLPQSESKPLKRRKLKKSENLMKNMLSKKV